MSTSVALIGSNIIKPADGESYSLPILNGNYDAIVAEVNKLPRGLQAIQDIVAPTGSTGALAVQQWIPSFTFKANRWYEVFWQCSLVSSGAGTSGLAQIQTTPTSETPGSTANLTEIRGINLNFTGAHSVVISASRKIKYGSDTTLQVKGTIIGNGINLYMNAGPTFPAQLSITDLGQAI